MTRGLLDTSVLIAWDDELRSQGPEEAAISVVSLAELHYGVLVAKTPEIQHARLRRLGAIEASFQPLPVDAAVSRAYAAVAHAVKTAGRQPKARVMDLWIAAIALTHGLPLYTRNAADFEGLQGLVKIQAV